ncbi:MAG TPA: TIGR02453 family protein [Cytophagales bacterium]|nr:TIGR02453 family protein [Cytophagales bacterium]HAA18929.1 TIGR02453 family protein [Cytophagales bacterium]HAP62096.1 TIGR02453 family protein [Cytophagales bacterium]
MHFASALDFLADLQENNHKEWFDANRKTYEAARDEFKVTLKHILADLARKEEEMAGLEPKDVMFRINRDIRFSKNKNPYKNNMGAFMGPGGRKTEQGGYYLHVQPNGESFVAGGIYMPPPENLKKIRQEIDYNPVELKKILEEPIFAETWGALMGETLKTAPKGYPKDHPNIELLKHKSFIVMHKLSDQEMRSDGIVEQLLGYFDVLRPMNAYFNVAVS